MCCCWNCCSWSGGREGCCGLNFKNINYWFNNLYKSNVIKLIGNLSNNLVCLEKNVYILDGVDVVLCFVIIGWEWLWFIGWILNGYDIVVFLE